LVVNRAIGFGGFLHDVFILPLGITLW